MTPQEKLLAHVLAPRPAWCIRSVGLPGEFFGTVPRGFAHDEVSAVEWYLAHNPRCTVKQENLRAFPKTEGKAA